MRATVGTNRAEGRRFWMVAAAAAFLGWLFAAFLLIAGVRPLGWVLLGAAVTTLALAPLYARARSFKPSEVFAFVFACIMLEWPVLSFVAVLILSWARIGKWE